MASIHNCLYMACKYDNKKWFLSVLQINNDLKEEYNQYSSIDFNMIDNSINFNNSIDYYINLCKDFKANKILNLLLLIK